MYTSCLQKYVFSFNNTNSALHVTNDNCLQICSKIHKVLIYIVSNFLLISNAIVIEILGIEQVF